MNIEPIIGSRLDIEYRIMNREPAAKSFNYLTNEYQIKALKYSIFVIWYICIISFPTCRFPSVQDNST